MSEDIPNPGTDEAIERGCTCPILDNPYKGIEGRFVYSMGCPIHAGK